MSSPISARVDASHYTHSIAPDVCLTPIGSIMVPVPYYTIAFFDHVERTSRTVRNNGAHDLQINSRPVHCTGHEPGTGKGIVSKGYVRHAVLKKGSETVFSEGWPVVRDNDSGEINRPDVGRSEQRRTKTKSRLRHS